MKLRDKFNLVLNRSEYKRLMGVAIVAIATVVITGYLNLQSDDEIHIGCTDYTCVFEAADWSDGVITVDESMGASEGDVIAETSPMHLDAGRFILDVDHQNEYPISVTVFDKENRIAETNLPAEESNTRFEFSSDKNMYNMKIRFVYGGEGKAILKRSILYSNGGPFYSDTIVYSVLLVLGVILLVCFIIYAGFFDMSTGAKLCVVAVLVYILFANYLYYRPFPLHVEDVEYHVARIEASYNELKRGQFPIIIYSDFLQGRGMIGIMYPYLFLIIPALLRMVHMSPEGSIRLFFIFISYATCGTSFYAAKRIFKNRYIAVITMMLYGMLLYRITTMTYRYAYGEVQAFVFYPLVILGLYEIITGDRKKWCILTIGMTGMLQCHLLSFIQATVVCFVVAVVFLVQLIKSHRIIQLIYAGTAAVLINLWYVIPFLSYYNEDLGIYDHLSWGENINGFASYFADMLRFYPNTSDGETQHKMGLIGVWLAILALAAIYKCIKRGCKDPREKFALCLMVIGASALFLATRTFPWETALKFRIISKSLEYLQFVGRFYLSGEVLVLFGSMMLVTSGWYEEKIEMPYEFKANDNIIRILFLSTILTIASLQAYAVTDSWLSRSSQFVDSRTERYVAGVNDSEVEDYVPSGYWFGEGFPTSAYSPSGNITDYRHEETDTYFVYSSSEESFVDLPITYYSDYSAVNEEGDNLDTIQGDGGCVRVILPANTEKEAVCVTFRARTSWRISMVISILSSIVLLIYVIRGISTSDEQGKIPIL